MIPTVGPLPLIAWPKVAIIIIISSTPSKDSVYKNDNEQAERAREGYSHMRLRPTTSASQPNRSCPKKLPIGVATLTPRSWLVFRA